MLPPLKFPHWLASENTLPSSKIPLVLFIRSTSGRRLTPSGTLWGSIRWRHGFALSLVWTSTSSETQQGAFTAVNNTSGWPARLQLRWTPNIWTEDCMKLISPQKKVHDWWYGCAIKTLYFSSSCIHIKSICSCWGGKDFSLQNSPSMWAT